MGSAKKHHDTTTKAGGGGVQTTKSLAQYPTTSSDNEDMIPPPPPPPSQNPNPNLESIPMESESIPPFTIDETEEDMILSKSEYLSREEVIKRRYRRLKLEIQVYEDYYWALMEEYRVKHREYYWNYGKSPFQEETSEMDEEKKDKGKDENGGDPVEGIDEGKLVGTSENGGGGGGGGSGKNKRCALNGCKLKPMALTTYCHTHILSDSKQKLYKPCTYITKSQGIVPCGKPILRATVPSLCAPHFLRAQTHVQQALRRAGFPNSSLSRPAPKFHVIVAESIRLINSRRRERRANAINNVANVSNNVNNNAGGKVLDKEEINTNVGDKEENNTSTVDKVLDKVESNVTVGDKVLEKDHETAG
ncbi:hypothetical protein ACHQM5_028157 [Ranunculus cassubicifolius]